MSDTKTEGRVSLTIPVILAHPSLFEPKQFKKNGKPNGEPKFSGNFVFAPDNADLKRMKTIAAQVARAKWPTRDLKELKFPFSNGDKLADARKAKSGKDDGAYQRGKVVMSSRSKYRPRLSVVDSGRIVDLEDDALIAKFKSKFFFGAETLAEFNFVVFEGGNGPDGVTAYLNQVLATGKGTKIAGGASGSETFKGYIGSASAEDPTGGELDDEIPF